MSAKHSSPPANWELVSKKKKAEQTARIPTAWKLSTLPGPEVTNYTEIPRQCGLLTQEELQITEQYDAVALAAAIREKRFKCLDVARAFCKVSAVPL
jgi:amidase